jgi:hypothetical protein
VSFGGQSFDWASGGQEHQVMDIAGRDQQNPRLVGSVGQRVYRRRASAARACYAFRERLLFCQPPNGALWRWSSIEAVPITLVVPVPVDFVEEPPVLVPVLGICGDVSEEDFWLSTLCS